MRMREVQVCNSKKDQPHKEMKKSKIILCKLKKRIRVNKIAEKGGLMEWKKRRGQKKRCCCFFQMSFSYPKLHATIVGEGFENPCRLALINSNCEGFLLLKSELSAPAV